MARSELSVIKSSGMATAAAGGLSSDYGVATRTGAAYGVYVKCTGLDPTKLIFMISRNSSECSSVGYVDVIAGSTLGKDDFEPGRYSTLRNFRILIAKTTNFVDKGSTGDGSFNGQFFRIPETSRFLDSDQRLNFRFSATLSASANASHGSFITAILLA